MPEEQKEKAPKSKPKEAREEEIRKPEPRRVVSSKVSEQEKKLRGYFPWLKL